MSGEAIVKNDASKSVSEPSIPQFGCTVEPQSSFKVQIRLRPAGGAPQLSMDRVKISSDKKFSTVINSIKKELGLEKTQSLFLFLQGSFAPAPDETIYDLCRNFGDGDKLVIHYSLNQAWG